MTENNWRKLAEENGLDCTLRRVEIKCVLEHEPVKGEDFMPYGWCGDCETCLAMECPDVCEACSYTSRYDLKQPVIWPCMIEQQRLRDIERAAEDKRIEEIKRTVELRRRGGYLGRES